MEKQTLVLKSTNGGAIFSKWFTVLLPLEYMALKAGEIVHLKYKGVSLGDVEVKSVRIFKMFDCTDLLAASQNGDGDITKLQKQLNHYYGKVAIDDYVQHALIKYEGITKEGFQDAVKENFDQFLLEVACID